MEDVRARASTKRTRSSFSTRDSHRPVKPLTKISPRDEQERSPRAAHDPPTPGTPHSAYLSTEGGRGGHSQRDSLKSIRDDPFFRNYQSPHSVSLARELRYARYSERLRSEIAASDPNATSKQVEEENSVSLPVCLRVNIAREAHHELM